MSRRLNSLSVVLALVVTALFAGTPAVAQDQEEVIVKSSGSREELKRAILSVGGKIRHEFQNLNAVAATVSTTAMTILDSLREIKVMKDSVIHKFRLQAFLK